MYKRKKYVASLVGGESLYTVDNTMERHIRDKSSYLNGIRFKEYVIDDKKSYEYAELCFYRESLIGKSEEVCRYAADEQSLINDAMAEVALFERTMGLLGVSLDIEPAPGNKELSLRGITVGKALPKKLSPCPGQTIDTVPDVKVLKQACTLPFYTDKQKYQIINLPPIGVDGEIMVETTKKGVDSIYFFVNRYEDLDSGDKLLVLLKRKFGDPQRFLKNRIVDDKGRYHLKKMGLWNIGGDLLYMSTYGEHARRPVLLAINNYFNKRAKAKKNESLFTNNL